MNPYTDEFKTLFNENAAAILELYLIEGAEFTLFIHNNNNWNKPLPKNISAPDILRLDFSKIVIENTVLKPNGIELNIMFGDELYKKTIHISEVIAIFELSNNEPKTVLYKPFSENIIDCELNYDNKIGIIRELINDKVTIV